MPLLSWKKKILVLTYNMYLELKRLIDKGPDRVCRYGEDTVRHRGSAHMDIIISCLVISLLHIIEYLIVLLRQSKLFKYAAVGLCDL